LSSSCLASTCSRRPSPHAGHRGEPPGVIIYRRDALELSLWDDGVWHDGPVNLLHHHRHTHHHHCRRRLFRCRSTTTLSTAPTPSIGVPIHLVQFPPSPSPLLLAFLSTITKYGDRIHPWQQRRKCLLVFLLAPSLRFG
jgi:hypothetical protein